MIADILHSRRSKLCIRPLAALVALITLAGAGPATAAAPEGAGPGPSAGAEAGKGEDAWAAARERMVPVLLGEDGWMLYRNSRYEFVLPVPPGMCAERRPDNGDGAVFHSADGRVELRASGALIGPDGNDNIPGLDSLWRDELAVKGRTVTCKRKADGWFVISGIEADGTYFYLHLACDEHSQAAWSIRYPSQEKDKVAEWIKRISRGYEARLGEGVG